MIQSPILEPPLSTLITRHAANDTDAQELIQNPPPLPERPCSYKHLEVNLEVPLLNHQTTSSSTVFDGFDVTPIPVVKPSRGTIGRWRLGKTIGEGSSGKVKLAIHIDTQAECVVKAVRRPKLNQGNKEGMTRVYKRELYMIREACLGNMLNHPNIVKLTSAFLGENHFYCFFELVEGEDLVDHISRFGAMSEAKTRDIFRQIVSAVDYVHRNHIVHRDIKLENIRYNSTSGVVKLLDFGFATFYHQDPLITNCGSPCYAAPEIYDNLKYDGCLVDVWSLGVFLHLN